MLSLGRNVMMILKAAASSRNRKQQHSRPPHAMLLAADALLDRQELEKDSSTRKLLISISRTEKATVALNLFTQLGPGTSRPRSNAACNPSRGSQKLLHAHLFVAEPMLGCRSKLSE